MSALSRIWSNPFSFLHTFHVSFWTSNNIKGNIAERHASGNQFLLILRPRKTFLCSFFHFIVRLRLFLTSMVPSRFHIQATATLYCCTKIRWNNLLENNYQLSGYNHFHFLEQGKYSMYIWEMSTTCTTQSISINTEPLPVLKGTVDNSTAERKTEENSVVFLCKSEGFHTSTFLLFSGW